MNENELKELLNKPNGVSLAIIQINNDVNRLIAFVRNSNTYGTKIFPELIEISEGKK